MEKERGLPIITALRRQLGVPDLPARDGTTLWVQDTLLALAFTGLFATTFHAAAVGLGAADGKGFAVALGVVATSMMLGLAFMTAGGLVGFVFGIPRSGPASNGDGAETQMGRTPIEQISDWLTKILVGVGLTELGSLPTHLDTLATALKDDLGGSFGFALALIVYGTIVGFFAGYLLTRLLLQPALVKVDRELERMVKAMGQQPVAIDGAPADTSPEVRAAAARLVDVPMDELKTAQELRAYARAQIIEGAPAVAETSLNKALTMAPDDPETLTLRGVAKLNQGRHADAIRDLETARRRMTPASPPALWQQLYDVLTYCYLFEPPPSGFQRAIDYANEYIASGRAPSVTLLINLACGYGQAHRHAKGGGAPPEEIGALRASALDATRKAIARDPAAWARLEALRQGTGTDDDLSSFKGDPEFDALLGRAAA